MNRAKVGSAAGDLPVQSGRVFRAGNSLAIRIPKAIAGHCELEDGAPIEIGTTHGAIIVRKATSNVLAELIDRITPENRHATAFEDLIGRERW
jgi:antitoxin component of MazEF toxin-antitoxin module